MFDNEDDEDCENDVYVDDEVDEGGVKDDVEYFSEDEDMINDKDEGNAEDAVVC